MLENFIMQVRRPKGVLGERVAFVSPAAKVSAAACCNNDVIPPYHFLKGSAASAL